MSTTHSFSNSEIAKLLTNVSAVSQLNGDNIFRIKAFQNASSSIENFPTQIVDLWNENKLDEVPGIGKALKSDLDELFRTGHVKHYDEMMSVVPAGMFALMDIPGIGPKNAHKLATFFKLKKAPTAIKDLLAHAKAGEVSELEGFTPVGEKRIIESITAMRSKPDARMLLPTAEQIALEVLTYLRKNPKVVKADVLGSLRRRAPTIGDVDIAVASQASEEVLRYASEFPHKKRVIGSGEKSAAFIHSSGWQVDVKVVDPDEWGSILPHFTGGKMHNIHLRTIAQKKGLSLNEFGIEKDGTRKKFATEESFYDYLGLQWIPPELREDTGEIEAALAHTLPTLLDLSDITGDFHIHTNVKFPTSHDTGTSTIDDILLTAKDLGYSSIGLSDHNPKRSNFTARERLTAVRKRNDDIDEAVERFFKGKPKTIEVYKGLEIDILPDGNLALEDEAIETLDYVIASIHSSFTQDRKTATTRVVKALSHPMVTIMGHPSGQLLQERDGIDVDWNEIFATAKELGKILEINASPNRTDLSSPLIKCAITAGVKLIINTDSHNAESMRLMKYGVSNARRGWATKKNIVNTTNEISF